ASADQASGQSAGNFAGRLAGSLVGRGRCVGKQPPVREHDPAVGKVEAGIEIEPAGGDKCLPRLDPEPVLGGRPGAAPPASAAGTTGVP
ncbi:MAG: hypothetical protein WCJ18_06600, partial [Planctomycetota bacterium]